MIDRKYYILGLPVQTDIGEGRHLLVKDYPKLEEDLNIVSLTKNHFINLFEDKNSGFDKKTIQQLRELELIQLVLTFEDVKSSYEKVFNHIFNLEESIFNILETKEEFYNFRKIVLELSNIKEEYVSPNPEIQRAIDRSRRLNSMNNDIEFADIVSSVSVYTGKSYEEINNMTMFQLYMDFHRIARLLNYETSVLYSTIAPDKVDVTDWNSHINLFEDEKVGLTKQEFGKIASKIED